jgi:hypothetical protein
MRELNVNEIKQVNGGRWLKLLRFLATEMTPDQGSDRYGSGGWRP